MKNLNERILDVSQHLQTLSAKEFSSEVQCAVEKNDKTSLIKVCKRAKIPQSYIGTVVSVVLSVSPQKWPSDL
jgi:hypothetical protein